MYSNGDRGYDKDNGLFLIGAVLCVALTYQACHTEKQVTAPKAEKSFIQEKNLEETLQK